MKFTTDEKQALLDLINKWLYNYKRYKEWKSNRDLDTMLDLDKMEQQEKFLITIRKKLTK